MTLQEKVNRTREWEQKRNEFWAVKKVWKQFLESNEPLSKEMEALYEKGQRLRKELGWGGEDNSELAILD